MQMILTDYGCVPGLALHDYCKELGYTGFNDISARADFRVQQFVRDNPVIADTTWHMSLPSAESRFRAVDVDTSRLWTIMEFDCKEFLVYLGVAGEHNFTPSSIQED